MKYFFRILSFARAYSIHALLNIVFNVLATIFSLFSVALIIPILGILFGTQERVYEKPEFALNKDAVVDNFSYFITQLIENHGERYALLVICGILVGAYFFKNVFRYGALFFLAKLRNGTIRNVRNALHKKVLELPLGYYGEKRKGDIMARMSGDMTEIEWSLLTALEALIKQPIMIIASIALLFTISPSLTLFILVLLPVSAIVISTIGRSLRKKSDKAQNLAGHLLSVIEESLAGLRVIKSFNAERSTQKRFEDVNNELRKNMNGVLHRKDMASPISEFLGSIVIASVIYYGSSLILGGNELKPEVFFGYLFIFFQIISPAKTISSAFYNIQKGNASSKRIFDILDSPVAIRDAENAQEIETFQKSIQFKGVSFSYGEGLALDHINLDIPQGKSVALVGQSGSGKTTMANLLPRFYDVTQGSIEIDGIDIRSVKLKSLRNTMGIVTQESILFNDTIANNIKLGKPGATPEEVRRAAEIANAHEFIELLPDGYDTNIGDGGNRLSGGQKQRISIARAVLKNPPILILDEATSALDTESERLVQEALENVMRNRTSVVIAHRLSTIQNADIIVVMQNGTIKEKGTHEELLEKSGIYAHLIELQSFNG